MALFFEEFAVGASWDSPARTITEADVVAFAGLTGDYNPLHTDEEFAKGTPFGRRIAHGLLGLAIATGLSTRLGLVDGTVIAFLGLEWKFTGPIFIGDTIRQRMTVTSVRETRKPDRGVVVFDVKVLNQRDEVVQEGTRTIMVKRRVGGEVV